MILQRLVRGYQSYMVWMKNKYIQKVGGRFKLKPGTCCVIGLFTDVAKRLGISQPGVGYAVSRGEKIAKKHNYQLSE